MAYFEISNLIMDKGLFSCGNSVIVSFTLKNTITYDDGKKKSFSGISFSLRGYTKGVFGTISDEVKCSNVELAYGESANISVNFRIKSEHSASIANYFEANPDKRSLSVELSMSTRVGVTVDGGMESHLISESHDTPAIYLKSFRAPKINNFKIERSTDGALDDEGEKALYSMQIWHTPEENANADTMKLHLHFAENEMATEASDYFDLTAWKPDLLAGVVNATQLLSGQTFKNTSNWSFLLVLGDEFEKVSEHRTLPRSFANLHLSGKSTGGACFGGFSTSGEGTPKLESYYPGYFYGGIQGVTNYSDGEVATGGRWIDGKPIYRRVFASGAFNLAKGSHTTTIAAINNFSDIDKILDMQGGIKFSGQFFPITRIYATNGFHAPYVSDGEVKLRTVYSDAALNVEYCFVVLFYTKTDT